MNILLIGCTGFLGNAIIYKYLTQTDHNLYIVIRPKGDKTIRQRFESIMEYIHLDSKKYKKRVRLIQAMYDENRNIIMNKKDDNSIKRNIDILVNALADIKFNRELKKATLNNTVTALKWMEKLQECKKSTKYIYVSSAFVNFHRKEEGEIGEKIYETEMSHKTLTNILDDRQTTIGKYYNTYLYTKQLSEVLLRENKGDKELSIIRPSIIIPALTEPYPGWGKIQTISFAIIGVATGILSMYKTKETSYHNTVPVDLVAKDCLDLTEKSSTRRDHIEIRHACLTGNVKNWFTSIKKFKKDLIDRSYEYFKKTPIVLNNRKLIPFRLEIKNTIISIIVNIVIHLFRLVRHWYNWSTSWRELGRMLYKNIIFTYRFNRTFMRFTEKRVIFKRKIREKDEIYTNKTYEECYFEFVKNIRNIIHHDTTITRIFN